MSTQGFFDVLIVEDEPDLCDVLVTSLTSYGLNTRGVHDSRELDNEYALKPARILLLDLNLPGEDGYSIAVRYRKTYPNIGIVMLTARGDLLSRRAGYAEGADQYFVKPVDHQELALALHSLARRLSSDGISWVVDVFRKVLVTPDLRSCELTYNETKILTSIAEGAGAVVKRSVIFGAQNCLADEFVDQRLETALSRLRRKMRLQGLPSLPVKACPGIGYAFVDAVSIRTSA
jgi:two-component system OmpR family response regulator